MRSRLVKFTNRILGWFNIALTTKIHLERMQALNDAYSLSDTKFLNWLPAETRPFFLSEIEFSQSQLRQDLFVLFQLNFRRNGYFVEFGAANGRELSNSFLLEHRYDWTGILAEPARHWHGSLLENRPASIIETSCVWRVSGSTIMFHETPNPENSTIDEFSDHDRNRIYRLDGKKYEVTTISLIELLDKNSAPKVIDYLSIDTEGSEYSILEAFDFKAYQFQVITVEHAFEPRRKDIFELLTQNGYIRVAESISDFDDWYIHASVVL
jgi:FkbM family methyltransferase